MPCAISHWAKSAWSDGPHFANADVLAEAVGRRNRHRQQLLDRRIALVESVRPGRNRGQAERQLGQVVGTDRETVEDLKYSASSALEGISHIAIKLQRVLAPLGGPSRPTGRRRHAPRRAMRTKTASSARRWSGPVRCTFFIARHFELEAVVENECAMAGRRRGSRASDSLGLVDAAAEELAVFVRLEVGHAHDHRLGIEGGGNGGDALDQLLDESSWGWRNRAPGGRFPRAGSPSSPVFEDGLRWTPIMLLMTNSTAPGPHPHSASGRTRGQLRVADVHHHLELRRHPAAHVLAAHLEIQPAAIDVTGVALGTTDR